MMSRLQLAGCASKRSEAFQSVKVRFLAGYGETGQILACRSASVDPVSVEAIEVLRKQGNGHERRPFPASVAAVCHPEVDGNKPVLDDSWRAEFKYEVVPPGTELHFKVTRSTGEEDLDDLEVPEGVGRTGWRRGRWVTMKGGTHIDLDGIATEIHLNDGGIPVGKRPPLPCAVDAGDDTLPSQVSHSQCPYIGSHDLPVKELPTAGAVHLLLTAASHILYPL